MNQQYRFSLNLLRLNILQIPSFRHFRNYPETLLSLFSTMEASYRINAYPRLLRLNRKLLGHKAEYYDIDIFHVS